MSQVVDIDDLVAVVGDESFAPDRLAPALIICLLTNDRAIGMTSTGSGKFPSARRAWIRR